MGPISAVGTAGRSAPDDAVNNQLNQTGKHDRDSYSTQCLSEAASVIFTGRTHVSICCQFLRSHRVGGCNTILVCNFLNYCPDLRCTSVGSASPHFSQPRRRRRRHGAHLPQPQHTRLQGPRLGNCKSFQVTGLCQWQNDKTGLVSVKAKTIDSVNLDSYVAEETTGTEDDAQTLIVRLGWIDVDVKDELLRQSEQTTRLLVNVFGLKWAYGCARSCLHSRALDRMDKIPNPGTPCLPPARYAY